MYEDLSRFQEWCDTNGLFLNIDKCKVMRFYRNKQQINFDYTIGTKVLESLSVVKDLGIFFDTSLCFKDH